MSQYSAPGSRDSGPLIPPLEQAPGPPAGATREQCVAMWLDLVEATDEILLAALRSRYGSPEEVKAAYRRIYARQVEEHDKKMLHMMREFDRRSGNGSPNRSEGNGG